MPDTLQILCLWALYCELVMQSWSGDEVFAIHSGSVQCEKIVVALREPLELSPGILELTWFFTMFKDWSCVFRETARFFHLP